MTDEIWKSIPGINERYQVSNKGRVRSWYKNGKVKILKPRIHKTGYCVLDLTKMNGKYRTVTVHRLVLDAFDSPHPDMQVNHINGIKTDNRLENLEWCTCKENVHHAMRSGLMKKPERKVLWVEENKVYESVIQLAREVYPEIKYAKDRIWDVCSGKRETYKGQHFKYVGEGPHKILWIEENRIYESTLQLVREVFPDTKKKPAMEGIHRVCKGTYKSYKGQHFKYVEDEDDEQ